MKIVFSKIYFNSFSCFIYIFILLFLFHEELYSQVRKENDFIHIGIIDAKDLYDNNAVFIDTNQITEYQIEHIAGAINISLKDINEDLEIVLYRKLILWGNCPCSFRPIDVLKMKFVLYGSKLNNENIYVIARKMKENKFRNIFILIDELATWKNARYPIFSFNEDLR